MKDIFNILYLKGKYTRRRCIEPDITSFLLFNDEPSKIANAYISIM